MSYTVEESITLLKETFKQFKFEFGSIEFGGTIPFFLIFSENEKKLEEKWDEIADFIAVDFQSRQTDEFQVWNIYVFYITESPIKKELKYKIENDTFSSRKIIIDDTKDIDLIIRENIINSLSIGSSKKENSNNKFEPNEKLEILLKNKVLKKTNITKEANKTYIELLKTIKSENNEI